VNNTLVTTAVMTIAPVERLVSSTTYGFVRFIDGGWRRMFRRARRTYECARAVLDRRRDDRSRPRSCSPPCGLPSTRPTEVRSSSPNSMNSIGSNTTNNCRWPPSLGTVD
jgi:hypothetical protein